MAKATNPGDVVRYEGRRPPRIAAFALVSLVGVELVYVLLFLWGLTFGDYREPIGQQVMAFWLGMIFLTFALILLLYRRFFLPDVIIVKKRHPKYEDFLQHEPNAPS